MTRTIVVGLDGAGFELLQPWLDAGDLPALERILDNGVHGDLQSVLPPVTSPNWKAYTTGKNPGKIGVFWWQNVDVDERRVYLPRERYHEHTEFWEILAERERVGVLNVPTTYPPKEAGEFVVSGPPDARDTGFTHPSELEARLRESLEYRVRLAGRLSDGDREAFEEALELTDLRFRTARRLLEAYDLSFLHVTAFYINSLHHHVWDGEYAKRAWEIVDDHLASFLAEEGDDVVLMSDHGHAEIETVFNVNAWLEREGYLTYDADVADAMLAVGVNADRLKRLLVRADRLVPGTNVRQLAEGLTPQWFLNRLPNERGELGGSKHEIADWDRSEALASAQGPVYLVVDRDEPRYEELRTELIEKLAALTGPDGRPIARTVSRAEEVYHGPYLDEAPDVVIDKAPHVNVREGFGSDSVFPESDPNWAGTNERAGLFAATGPTFREGTVEGMSILDLAPTLLHLHDRAVPDDMDGSVRRDVFAQGTTPATTEVRRREVANLVTTGADGTVVRDEDG